jgi:hypothetical protein
MDIHHSDTPDTSHVAAPGGVTVAAARCDAGRRGTRSAAAGHPNTPDDWRIDAPRAARPSSSVTRATGASAAGILRASVPPRDGAPRVHSASARLLATNTGTCRRAGIGRPRAWNGRCHRWQWNQPILAADSKADGVGDNNSSRVIVLSIQRFGEAMTSKMQFVARTMLEGRPKTMPPHSGVIQPAGRQ